jgi:DNA-binding CsgD family transcriptional regulator
MVTSSDSRPRLRDAIARELDHFEAAFGDNPEVRAAVAAEYLRRGARGGGTNAADCALSERERFTLIRYALGCRNRATAGELGISIRTLETYLDRARAKLGIHTREQVVRFAIGQGWFA